MRRSLLPLAGRLLSNCRGRKGRRCGNRRPPAVAECTARGCGRDLCAAAAVLIGAAAAQ